MIKAVRGVLEEPTMLRLEEPVELPLHVPVEVTISEPVLDDAPPSAFLALAGVLRVNDEGEPTDLSERWETYVAADDAKRSQ